MKKNCFAIGVDFGGTKIAIGLVDRAGNIHKKIRVATDVKGGPSAIQNQIASAVKELCQISNHDLIGIGIGAPGQIERGTGIVKNAPNLKWKNVPFQQNLSNALQLPVVITNDVRAATWGEWLFGAGKGCGDIVCVFFGTGVGGGVVSEGRILTGCNNSLGEVGHMIIDINGPLCSCGNRGCFESLTSGKSIGRQTQEAVKENPITGKFILDLANQQIENVTSEILLDAVKAQDELALSIISKIKEYFIAGCTNVVNAYNPCRLILGGGFIEGAPFLIPDIKAGICHYALPAATEKLEVLPTKLGGDAGIIGAAAFAFHHIEDNKEKS